MPTLLRRQSPNPISFVCGDKTLTWETSWYTQAFYTSSSSFYDTYALHGPINPPWEVWGTVSACLPPLTATYTPSPISVSLTATPSLSSPARSLSESAASIASATLRPVPSRTTSAAINSLSLSRELMTSTAAFPSVTPLSSLSQSSSPSPALPTPTTPLGAPGFDAVHAGSWDAQAKGTVFIAIVTFGIGVLVWCLWAALRQSRHVFFSPRSWFLPPSSRPPAPTVIAFLVPFLHLPTLASLTSQANVFAHVNASILGMVMLCAVLSLAVFLPLIVAGVPHLDTTSPNPILSGRFGSLTNLSILRLLGALDPSPSARTLATRALPTTLAPAIDSARPRLFALMIISATLWVGGCLFIIWLVSRRLFRYVKAYDDACAGQEMVFVPNQKSWNGKSEAVIKDALSSLCKAEGKPIAAVFSVGHFPNVRANVEERIKVHHALEEAETKYIKALAPSPTSPMQTGLGAFAPTSSSLGLTSSSRTTGFNESITDFTPMIPQGSAFLEVQQRSSVIRHKGRLMIGQRVVRDDDGTFLPAPGDSDDDVAALQSAPILKSSGLVGNSVEAGGSADGKDSPEAWKGIESPRGKERPLSSQTIWTLESNTFPDQIATPPISQALNSDLISLRAEITWARARLTKLNAVTSRAQTHALASLTSGEGSSETARVGCIIVGRGVKDLPNAIDLPGRTKEDIMWHNLGEPAKHLMFWVKAVGTMVLVAGICLPFLGLAVASAPGVAHYLSFFKPLAQNNGIRSGITEGFVAALGVTLSLTIGVRLIQLFARQSRSISYTAQQSLILKGSFYLLLFPGTICFLLVGGLMFAIPAFHSNSQESRNVADGLAYLAYLSLVMAISVCTLVPGLFVLQPIRLLRWYHTARKANTPRTRFQASRPPNFNPATSLAPLVIAFLHLSALSGLFPLLVVPVLILAYLTLVAACWLGSYVWCVSLGGPSNGQMALWVVRRLGWAVCFQPFVLALMLLSRREWTIGGVGLGLTALGLCISEIITSRLRSSMRADPIFLERADLSSSSAISRQRESDASLLTAPYTLPNMFAGLSHLSNGNPLPLPTDHINDLAATERAAYATPHVTVDAFETSLNVPIVPMNPRDEYRGYIYPPELIAPAPAVWLPRDAHGLAQREAEALTAEGLEVVLDPELTMPSLVDW